jgi:hypothetical protein
VEDVRVQVDETRGDDLPVCVDHEECRLGRNAAVDDSYPAARDRDIEPSFVPSTRIDDIAAPDEQVVSHRSFPV